MSHLEDERYRDERLFWISAKAGEFHLSIVPFLRDNMSPEKGRKSGQESLSLQDGNQVC